MIIARISSTMLALAFLAGMGAPARADGPPDDSLRFTRAVGASGTVNGTASGSGSGSFVQSAAAAGVPAAALGEILRALATIVDADREVRDGDRFYVRYERTFALGGAPVDGGRALWAELQLQGRRMVGIYRFRPHDAAEQFWTNNAMSAAPPPLRLPLDRVIVSSGFGLRADPFDQPAGRAMGMGPLRGFSWRPGGLAMHYGVDLVAPPGTAVHAAGDGTVIGAEPNGRYGNWIEIEHAGRLATVYGHLSDYAPGISPGAKVRRGDVIGHVGATGRATGPHVHFELLVDGRPVNPIVSPAIRRRPLRGPDLVAFRRAVAALHTERRLEELRP